MANGMAPWSLYGDVTSQVPIYQTPLLYSSVPPQVWTQVNDPRFLPSNDTAMHIDTTFINPCSQRAMLTQNSGLENSQENGTTAVVDASQLGLDTNSHETVLLPCHLNPQNTNSNNDYFVRSNQQPVWYQQDLSLGFQQFQHPVMMHGSDTQSQFDLGFSSSNFEDNALFLRSLSGMTQNTAQDGSSKIESQNFPSVKKGPGYCRITPSGGDSVQRLRIKSSSEILTGQRKEINHLEPQEHQRFSQATQRLKSASRRNSTGYDVRNDSKTFNYVMQRPNSSDEISSEAAESSCGTSKTGSWSEVMSCTSETASSATEQRSSTSDEPSGVTSGNVRLNKHTPSVSETGSGNGLADAHVTWHERRLQPFSSSAQRRDRLSLDAQRCDPCEYRKIPKKASILNSHEIKDGAMNSFESKGRQLERKQNSRWSTHDRDQHKSKALSNQPQNKHQRRFGVSSLVPETVSSSSSSPSKSNGRRSTGATKSETASHAMDTPLQRYDSGVASVSESPSHGTPGGSRPDAPRHTQPDPITSSSGSIRARRIHSSESPADFAGHGDTCHQRSSNVQRPPGLQDMPETSTAKTSVSSSRPVSKRYHHSRNDKGPLIRSRPTPQLSRDSRSLSSLQPSALALLDDYSLMATNSKTSSKLERKGTGQTEYRYSKPIYNTIENANSCVDDDPSAQRFPASKFNHCYERQIFPDKQRMTQNFYHYNSFSEQRERRKHLQTRPLSQPEETNISSNPTYKNEEPSAISTQLDLNYDRRNLRPWKGKPRVESDFRQPAGRSNQIATARSPPFIYSASHRYQSAGNGRNISNQRFGMKPYQLWPTSESEKRENENTEEKKYTKRSGTVFQITKAHSSGAREFQLGAAGGSPDGEENWWKVVQGEAHLRHRNKELDDVIDTRQDSGDTPLPVEDRRKQETRVKLSQVIAILQTMPPKENPIQTLENCLAISRTLLKNNYQVDAASVDGLPGYTGCLYVDDVFVSREWGMRKKPLKHAAFAKALQVLTTQSVDAILEQTDPGPVAIAMEGTSHDSSLQGEASTPGCGAESWRTKVGKLCNWLEEKPEATSGPVAVLLAAFRKSGCDLKYDLKVDPVYDDRGCHLVTKCRLVVEGQLVASAVAPGKRQAKALTCTKAVEMLRCGDLDSVLETISTNDGKDTEEEAAKLIQERCKLNTSSNMAAILDVLVAKAKRQTTHMTSDSDPVAIDASDDSDSEVTNMDAVTLVSKLCIQMKVKLTTLFKRVKTRPKTPDVTCPVSRPGIVCLVYVADRLLASCQRSSRRRAQASAFRSVHATLRASTGRELLDNFPVLEVEELSRPEVVDVVYKGHPKTTESNRYRFHRLHKQPEMSRPASDLVLLEHEDWTRDRLRHAHCILCQSATQSGLLLEWSVEQGMGSYRCEMKLQGRPVARCVAGSRREAVTLASAQALFAFYESQPVVQIFHPDHPSVWVTRNMILQGSKATSGDESVVINIEEPASDGGVNDAVVLKGQIASSIERHVSAFFCQSTLREFVTSPDWTAAERNHLRHLAYVRGLRCFTNKTFRGEIVVLSMRLDLLEHVAILKHQPGQCQGRYRLLPDSERPSRSDVAGELAANESVFIRARSDLDLVAGDATNNDDPKVNVSWEGREMDELEMESESSRYVTANTTWESNTSIAECLNLLTTTTTSDLHPPNTDLESRHAGQPHSVVCYDVKEQNHPSTRGKDQTSRNQSRSPSSSHVNVIANNENSISTNVTLEAHSTLTSSSDAREDSSSESAVAKGGHPATEQSLSLKTSTLIGASHTHLISLPPKLAASSTPGLSLSDKTKKRDNQKRSLFATVVSPVLSLSPSPSKLLLLASCRKQDKDKDKSKTDEESVADVESDQITTVNGTRGPVVPERVHRKGKETPLRVERDFEILHI